MRGLSTKIGLVMKLTTFLLLVTILVVGGLTFLPTLALGPIAEHLSLGF